MAEATPAAATEATVLPPGARLVQGWTVTQPGAETFLACHPDGRSMKIRVPQFEDTLDLIEVIAAVDDPHGRFHRVASVAFAVTELDGVPLKRPATKGELRAAGKALGNERFAVAVMTLFPPPEETDAAGRGDVALIAKN